MKAGRRVVLAGLAAVALPSGYAVWRRATRPSLPEAVRSVVQIAFGPRVLSDADLARFSQDLEPHLIRVFPDPYLVSCRDWVRRVAPQAIEPGGTT